MRLLAWILIPLALAAGQKEDKQAHLRAQRDKLIARKLVIESRIAPVAAQRAQAMAMSGQEEQTAITLDQRAAEMERRGGTEDLTQAADLRRQAEQHRIEARNHRIRGDLMSGEIAPLETELRAIDREIAAIDKELDQTRNS